MIRVPRLGIRGKLLVSFAALTAAIAIFAAAFFPARVERQTLRDLKEKTRAVRNLTAYSVSAALYFGDAAAMDEVIAGAAHYDEVNWIAVRDASDRLVASWGVTREHADARRPDEAFFTPDGLTYVSTSPVLHEGTRIGSVVMAVSAAEVRYQVWAARRLGLAAGVLVFLVGLGVVWVLSTLITRPLTHVVETVRRVAKGDLSLRAVEPRDPEIAELVRSLNQMVGNLANAQDVMADVNQELEARVAARTKELHSAIELQRRAQKALAMSEAAARESSEAMQSVIDVAPQAILTVDLDWRVTRWNVAAQRLFGWSAAEVLGAPVPYIPEEEHSASEALRRRVEHDERTGLQEVVRVRKDGTRVPVLVATAVLRDRRGAATGYIAVITDLSERKALEEQLRQSQKMEAIGRLAGGIAHDFNNILTIITATTGLLMAEEHSDEYRRDLNEILTAATRASALTRQLLTFSRQGVVQLESLRINGVIRSIAPMLRRLLRANIEFSMHLAEDLGLVSADASQLEQVIMNLAVNAADAMPDGGSLEIATRQTHIDAADAERTGLAAGGWVELTVRDTGVGMDASTLSRIFEPFFTTKDVGKGTGLGLATVYAVVAQLGGRVFATSAPGKGATFTIQLPCDAHAQEPVRVDATTPQATDATRPSTVLLVEDEEPVRILLKRMLERQGFVVLDAPDGTAALAIAQRSDVRLDVVVTDIMMPGMTGRALADRLSEMFPGLLVIFISGYADENVRERGLVDPTHLFLQKPFTAQDLVRMIRGALAAQKQVAA
jgi:PAS domain S-box-containing protein